MMARIYADRVMQQSNSTGVGDFTLAGLVAGFQIFNVVMAVGDTFDYAIYAVDGSGVPTGAWETGRGTYSAANTLTRTTIQASSQGGGAPTNFAAGSKYVLLTENASSIVALAAGGGSAGAAAPSVLSQAPVYARSNSGGTIALATAPTVGHSMMLMHIGATNGPGVPAGWSTLALVTETSGFPTGQKFWLASKLVLAGETGSVTFGGTDFGNLALFELDKANLVDVVPINPNSGGTFTVMPPNPRWGSGLRFFAAEHDQSDTLTFSAVAGMTVLNVYGGSSNHRASLAQLDPTFYDSFQVVSGGTFTNPGFVSFSFGKI
jgi:hypothetical protein